MKRENELTALMENVIFAQIYPLNENGDGVYLLYLCQNLYA